MFSKKYFEQYLNYKSIKSIKKTDLNFGNYCETILNTYPIFENNVHNFIISIVNDLNLHKKCEVCDKNLTIKQIIQNKCFCSGKCAQNSNKTKNKIKQTSLTKYGTDSPNKSQIVKKNKKQSILKKYNVENVSQLKSVKDKVKQTNIEKYGVEHPLQSKEILNKVKQTNIEKYGVEHPLQSKEILNKVKQTNIEKYGVENQIRSEQTQNKVKQTNIEKYGVEHPLQSKEILDKTKQSLFNNYLVKYPLQSNIIKEKAKQTLIQLYGVDNIFKLPNNVNKIIESTQQKYGVDFPLQSNIIKEKIKQTVINKTIEHIKLWEKYVIPMFDLNNFTGWKDAVYTWKCVKCNNIFDQQYKKTYLTHKDTYIPRCPICYDYKKSIIENTFYYYIKHVYKSTIKQHNRTLINPYELDIVIPDKKVAIEFDGLYWHSDLYKQSNYHLMKTELCEQQGYKLIHIFEDEWINKQEIIKNKLKSILGIDQVSIYARKCYIKEIDNTIKNQFLNQNHVQGEDKSSIKLGLYHGDLLVAVMTFGKSRFNKNYQYELIRYATLSGYRVIGGAGKLLKYFERMYHPDSIITYADRRYSQGNMYLKLGFTFSHNSEPNYWWIKGTQKLTRYQCQKHKLKNILGDKFDNNLSEQENMYLNGWNKIYDCGNMVFVK